MTPHLNTSACSQTDGPARLTTMNPDHGCLSTAHFTYHMENEHSLQFQKLLFMHRTDVTQHSDFLPRLQCRFDF